ncbi:relaxase/mobilization nuclease domain-containing protein [Phenylobacterium sp. LjRoot219]|uniref:relaxase/mobilization nuclease domain-containing protein n=1 Tax=Phenylobacterium sp. LjRoot219 TaxID=3342283 RepID=UPI003ED0B4E1
MTDFATVRGFEDLWRPVARPRRVPDRGVLPAAGAVGADTKARLVRIASRAPEVMVKITGRTRDGAHLQAHLKYISRDGALPLEGRDGEFLSDLRDVQELATDWAVEDFRKRENAAMSLSIVLSMPPGSSIVGTRDAARAFAQEVFGERFDYVFALHTDAGHPHVHLAVRSLGEDGVRLNPRKADLEQWRQTFARKLRNRGVEAEATPRRSRGIVRKAERIAVRKLRERHEAGGAPPPRVIRAAFEDASKIVDGAQVERPWERRILERQRLVREAYVATADALMRSVDAKDQALGEQVRAYVAAMPPPVTQRNQLVKAIRILRQRATDRARAGRNAPDTKDPGSPRRRS